MPTNMGAIWMVAVDEALKQRRATLDEHSASSQLMAGACSSHAVAPSGDYQPKQIHSDSGRNVDDTVQS